MYRLLIVDDESYIVEGLVELIQDYPSWELEVYRAYSALEALAWMERTKIDIVLTDIRMPGMSGLDLQAEVIRRWPRCKVIFLTGHHDFSYIHKALRNSGMDYVLKTEGDQAIIGAVEKALSSLNDDMEIKSMVVKADIQMREALPTLQRQYMWELLQGEKQAVSTMKEQMLNLHIQLQPDDSVLIFLGRMDGRLDDMKISERMLILFAIQNIAEEYLRAYATVVSFHFDHNKLVWFIQPLKEEFPLDNGDIQYRWKETIRFIHGTLESIQATCQQLLKMPVSFVSGNEPVMWEECADQFRTLKQLFSLDFGMEQELLLIYNESLEQYNKNNFFNDPNTTLQWKKMKILDEYWENGHLGEFAQALAEMMNVSVEHPNRIGDGIRLQVFHLVVSMFLAYLSKMGLSEQIGTEIDLSKLTRLEAHASWNDAIDYFIELSKLMMARKTLSSKKREHEVVRKIHRYVDSHLADDLSLTRLGELVDLNSSYLSRLYKQSTGIGLSEYIMNSRIEEAKRLLRDTSLKIIEISQILGFESAAYFTRFFKKDTGLTPKEFKGEN